MRLSLDERDELDERIEEFIGSPGRLATKIGFHVSRVYDVIGGREVPVDDVNKIRAAIGWRELPSS